MADPALRSFERCRRGRRAIRIPRFRAFYNTCRPHRATPHARDGVRRQVQGHPVAHRVADPSGTRVLVLVDELKVRVITEDGELLRELTLDPSRDYQPHGRSS